LLDRVCQKFPWFYEAWRLKAKIFQTIGLQKVEEAKWQDALENFSRGVKILLEVLKNSESDPALFRDLAELEINRFKLKVIQGERLPEDAFLSARSYLEKTLVANPDDQNGLILMAYLHRLYADQLMIVGRDPRTEIEETIKFSDRVLRVAARNIFALNQKMTAYLLYGAYLRSIGHNPIQVLRRAVEIGKQILQIDSEDPSIYNSMALAYWNIASYKFSHNLDPQPELNEGKLIIIRGLNVNSGIATLYNTFGNLLQTKAYYQLKKNGLVEKELITETMENFFSALGIEPGNYRYWNNLAETFLITARSSSNDQNSYQAVCTALVFSAEAIRLNPDFFWSYLTSVDAELMAARIKSKARKDCRIHFQNGAKLLKRKNWENGLLYPVILKKAELSIEQTRYEFENSLLKTEMIYLRLKEAEQALRSYPQDAKLFIWRGALYFYLAKKSQAKQYFKKACEDLKKAFQLNESLREEYPLFSAIDQDEA